MNHELKHEIKPYLLCLNLNYAHCKKEITHYNSKSEYNYAKRKFIDFESN